MESASTRPRTWEPLYHTLMRWLRDSRTDPHGHGDSQWRRIRSSLRRGGSLATEHYAYPYVLPVLGPNATHRERVIALRLCSLIAEHDKFPEFEPSDSFPKRSLGQWCNLVSRGLSGDASGDFDPTEPDSVAQRLAYLHTQNAEDAIVSIRRIMDLASAADNMPALDIKDLFRTFFSWGNGLSNTSAKHRRRVLEDYYAGFGTRTSTDPQKDSD